MKRPDFTFFALIIVTAIFTLFIRISLPSREYFNFGDIAVIFSGLIMGFSRTRNYFLYGALAGGIGSALADLIGGFGIFAPFTLIAKGLEAGFASIAAKRKGYSQYVFLLIGGICMIATYFFAEIFLPNFGYQLALTEIIPNIIQATGGIIGGRLTYEAYKRIKDDGNE